LSIHHSPFTSYVRLKQFPPGFFDTMVDWTTTQLRRRAPARRSGVLVPTPDTRHLTPDTRHRPFYSPFTIYDSPRQASVSICKAHVFNERFGVNSALDAEVFVVAPDAIAM
jgi:hypothetical protein